MITKEKLEELRTRMMHHKVINDVAIVELTAAELQELLDFVDEAFNNAEDEVAKGGR